MDLKRLEEILGYTFQDIGILQTAVTHSSYPPEQTTPVDDNEQLEFLGDAALGLVVTTMLYRSLKGAKEGELSTRRSRLVKSGHLSRKAKGIHLGEFLRLGRGEDRSGGREKGRILEDAMEAVIGAIYADGGFAACAEVVERLFSEDIDAIIEGRLNDLGDHKTRLQVLLQQGGKATPTYKDVWSEGPDHQKTFCRAVTWNGKELARGTGAKKREADQDAARNALQILTQESIQPQ